MKKIGGILLALGVVLMLIVGYNFYTEKNIAGLSPKQPDEESSHPFPWFPLLGGVVIAAGILLMTTSKKRI